MKCRACFSWAVAALLWCVTAYGQAPLTSTEVKNVIGAIKELKAEFDKNNAYDFDQMTQTEAFVQGRAAYDKYLGIIKSHGFAAPENWAVAVMRVSQAYAAYKMQQQQPNLHAQMQRSMTEMQNNPNLTPQQKQQMMQMMQQTTQSWGAYMNAPAADIEAVKPFAGEIERTFK